MAVTRADYPVPWRVAVSYVRLAAMRRSSSVRQSKRLIIAVSPVQVRPPLPVRAARRRGPDPGLRCAGAVRAAVRGRGIVPGCGLLSVQMDPLRAAAPVLSRLLSVQ